MSGYVPLSELPSSLEEGNFFSCNISLPPSVDGEALEVNVPRVSNIGRMAGLHGVRLDQYAGDQSTYEAPAIGGMLGSNMAAATGSGAAKKAERQRTFLEYPLGVEPSAYAWPIANIQINKTELTSDIASHTVRRRNDDDYRHKVWASKLDTELRAGLRSAAWQNLLQVEPASIPEAVLIGVLLAGMATKETIAVGIMGPMFLWVHAAELLINRKRLHEKRWSLFSGSIQPDRCALAGIYATLPLVRYRRK